MAYYCYYTPPDDYTWQSVAPINYFSNPDVSYMGLPTGTATANNAKVVRDNMVRPSSQAARNRRRPCFFFRSYYLLTHSSKIVYNV